MTKNINTIVSDIVIPSAPTSFTELIDQPGFDGELARENLEAPKPCPLDEERYTTTWSEYVPSNASRRPGAKSATNFRVFGVDPQGREIFGESWGEFGGLLVLMADPNVDRLEVQYSPIGYFDEDGVERTTTFDIMAHMRSGKRYAIAIKPEGRRESSGIDEICAAVKRDNPGFADDVFVRSDADISQTAIYNAGLVLRSRRICNGTHVEELAAIAARTSGRISIGVLLGLYRDDGVGFAAAILLLQAGLLEPCEPERLSRRTLVRWTARPEAMCELAPTLRLSAAANSLVITNQN